jgi:succinyl-CoA synthetase beta subunit
MKIINEVLFINLFQASQHGYMNLESVAVKERSNISPFTLSPIVAAPTVIDTISQTRYF